MPNTTIALLLLAFSACTTTDPEFAAREQAATGEPTGDIYADMVLLASSPYMKASNVQDALDQLAQLAMRPIPKPAPSPILALHSAHVSQMRIDSPETCVEISDSSVDLTFSESTRAVVEFGAAGSRP